MIYDYKWQSLNCHTYAKTWSWKIWTISFRDKRQGISNEDKDTTSGGIWQVSVEATPQKATIKILSYLLCFAQLNLFCSVCSFLFGFARFCSICFVLLSFVLFRWVHISLAHFSWVHLSWDWFSLVQLSSGQSSAVLLSSVGFNWGQLSSFECSWVKLNLPFSAQLSSVQFSSPRFS